MELRKVLLGLLVLGVSIGTVRIALADCAWPFKAEQWELELVSVTADGVPQEIDPRFADLSIVLQRDFDEDGVFLQYELEQGGETQRRTASFRIEPIPSDLSDAIVAQGGAQ